MPCMISRKNLKAGLMTENRLGRTIYDVSIVLQLGSPVAGFILYRIIAHHSLPRFCAFAQPLLGSDGDRASNLPDVFIFQICGQRARELRSLIVLHYFRIPMRLKFVTETVKHGRAGFVC